MHFRRLFELFRNRKVKEDTTQTKLEDGNQEFGIKYEQAKHLLNASLERYNAVHCQCAYPRFQQIVGIDCTDSHNSFKCYDTDLLINLSKPYFDIETSNLNDECTNNTWICKKCKSTYEYGWSDFSIQVERQKLKLKNLTINSVGKEVIVPIPLFLGLRGHSYPPNTAMRPANFVDFEKYMSES